MNQEAEKCRREGQGGGEDIGPRRKDNVGKLVGIGVPLVAVVVDARLTGFSEHTSLDGPGRLRFRGRHPDFQVFQETIRRTMVHRKTRSRPFRTAATPAVVVDLERVAG